MQTSAAASVDFRRSIGVPPAHPPTSGAGPRLEAKAAAPNLPLHGKAIGCGRGMVRGEIGAKSIGCG
ncbi:hypothetical protein [Rhodobacter ferrooxidans]|uniref:hypothetical protein n=1 Tax=Rhodobacter ferrooxidans TaxID=371731 RepID=UPI0002FD3DCA|nr:hypothetical protein [Rhodobacter sp. SW2]